MRSFTSLFTVIAVMSFNSLAMGEEVPRTYANEKLTMIVAKKLTQKFHERKKKYARYLKNPDLLKDKFIEKKDSEFYAKLRKSMKERPMATRQYFKGNDYIVKVGHVTMRTSAFSGYRGITYFNDIPFKYNPKKNLEENIGRLESFLETNDLLNKKTTFQLLDLFITPAYAANDTYHDMLKLHLTGTYAPVLSLTVGFHLWKDTGPEFLVDLLNEFKKDVNQFKADMCSNKKGWGRKKDNNGVTTHRILTRGAMEVADKLTVGGRLEKKRVFVDLLGKYASTTKDEVNDDPCSGDVDKDPCDCLFNPFKAHVTIGSHLRLSGADQTIDSSCRTFDQAYDCMEDAYSKSKAVYDRNGGYDSYIPMSVEHEGSDELGDSAVTRE